VGRRRADHLSRGGAQLAEALINVAVEFLPSDAFYAKSTKSAGEFWLDAAFTEAHSENVLWDSRGSSNYTRYGNPRVDELIEKIDTEMVTYGRDAYIEEAWCIVTDDVVYLPVRHPVTVWATHKGA
jgi:ABC-type transport system substrate-binding protein